jgi:hypothetical protein
LTSSLPFGLLRKIRIDERAESFDPCAHTGWPPYQLTLSMPSIYQFPFIPEFRESLPKTFEGGKEGFAYLNS